MLLNCGVGELESTLDCKEFKTVDPKRNQCWTFIGRTDAEAEAPLATWGEELTHWNRLWCWEWLEAGGQGDYRGWDGWMASPTRWTWVWVSSRSWWWTRKPGVLQSMGFQRVATVEWLNWTELNRFTYHYFSDSDDFNTSFHYFLQYCYKFYNYN